MVTMKNSIGKTTQSRKNRTTNSFKTKRIISEDDIRRRAYEIYQTNIDTPHNELDDWFRAEKELRGSDY
jgi:hypothetical protein